MVRFFFKRLLLSFSLLSLAACADLSSNSLVGTSIQSSCDAESVSSSLSLSSIFVGDMILPIEAIQSKEDLFKYWPEAAKAAEDSTLSSLGATQNGLTTWDNGILPLFFEANVSNNLRANIFSACDILATHANVSCVERTNEFYYVSVSTEFSGCFATVGRTRNGIINLEGACNDQTVILHELMHVFGAMHEQQHPERDQSVRVISENIQSEQEQNFTLLSPGGLTTDFDFDSIMLYTSFAFAIGPNNPTLVRKSVLCDSIPNSNFPNECLIPYNSDFSAGDSELINSLYGASTISPPINDPDLPSSPDEPTEPEACFFNS